MHPDLERLGMNHSIRVMRLVPQQPDIPFAFGAVRHAPCNHLERFCRDGLAAIVPGVRVAAHDRDRHCDRGSDQPLRFSHSLAASRPPYHARSPSLSILCAETGALAVPANGK